jgi:hypothetical protein
MVALLVSFMINFCLNTELKMDFDVELVGWLSATDNLEELFNWFTKEDIVELQNMDGIYMSLKQQKLNSMSFPTFNYQPKHSKVLRVIILKKL